MTIETLEEYRGIVSEMKAIEMEIDALYDVRKSPTGRESFGASGPGDPTGRSAMKIIEMKEKLLSKQEEWSAAVISIEQWLNTVDDAEIRSIIRWRYILGLSWKQTGKQVYGYPYAGDACRMRIKRFFRNN